MNGAVSARQPARRAQHTARVSLRNVRGKRYRSLQTPHFSLKSGDTFTNETFAQTAIPKVELLTYCFTLLIEGVGFLVKDRVDFVERRGENPQRQSSRCGKAKGSRRC